MAHHCFHPQAGRPDCLAREGPGSCMLDYVSASLRPAMREHLCSKLTGFIFLKPRGEARRASRGRNRRTYQVDGSRSARVPCVQRHKNQGTSDALGSLPSTRAMLKTDETHMSHAAHVTCICIHGDDTAMLWWSNHPHWTGAAHGVVCACSRSGARQASSRHYLTRHAAPTPPRLWWRRQRTAARPSPCPPTWRRGGCCCTGAWRAARTTRVAGASPARHAAPPAQPFTRSGRCRPPSCACPACALLPVILHSLGPLCASRYMPPPVEPSYAAITLGKPPIASTASLSHCHLL